MRHIQSEGIYGFADNEKDEYVFDETYVLTDVDKYNVNELNKLFYFSTPKTVRKKDIDVAPICSVKIQMIGGMLLDKPLLCLLDTGSTNTVIQQRALPKGCSPIQSNWAVVTTMANGRFDTSLSVCLKSIVLPEFVNDRVVDGLKEA